MSSQREVRLLEVAPGPAGVAAVLEALPAALAGDGPALGIAPAGADSTPPAPAPPSSAARPPSPRDPGAASLPGREPADQDHAGVDGDVAVVLATSGSTGRRSGVLLPASALLAAAHAVHARFGGPAAWLLALPVTGIGGLQVLVRSLVGQCDPWCCRRSAARRRSTRRSSPTATWRLDPSLPAWTSLVPAQAARLLDDPAGLAALRAYEVVLLGGARTPPALLAGCATRRVAAVTSYGMTETCGGCVLRGHPAARGRRDASSPPTPSGVGRHRDRRADASRAATSATTARDRDGVRRRRAS